jgi:hypothetical protein
MSRRRKDATNNRRSNKIICVRAGVSVICCGCVALIQLGMSTGRVYIGNLPNDVQEREIHDIFNKYGPVASCDVKGGRDGGPRFAFVEYDDPRDASESVRAENGQEFAGARMRVCPPVVIPEALAPKRILFWVACCIRKCVRFCQTRTVQHISCVLGLESAPHKMSRFAA